MKILDNLNKLLQNRELRKKVLITVALLIIVRVIAHIPLPGINIQALGEFFASNQILGILDIFSGGTLSRVSIAFLGVGPYITASIIMQLMTMIVPQLEELQKEGEQGRNKINQYSRLITVPVSILQSFGIISILRNSGVISSFSPIDLVTLLITTTAATLLLMWIGELISESGIGNGVSLIITTGILAGIPSQVQSTLALVGGFGFIDTSRLISIIGFILIAVVTIAFVVIMTEAIRKIPVAYARQIQQGQSARAIETFLPLKVNLTGVIPIIFALSIIVFPSLVAKFMQNSSSDSVVNLGTTINRIFDPKGVTYGVVYFLLVVVFTYFYTSIVFKPADIAENLQKRSGFIPGIRPGKETALYLSTVVSRITLPGAIFLGAIALLPYLMQAVTKLDSLVIGGTGVLIVVSVVLETASQVKAQLIQKSYEIYYR